MWSKSPALETLQQHRATLISQGNAELYQVPDTWDAWVKTVPIKSGGGISNFIPLPWQGATAETIIKNRDKRKSYTFCKSRQVGATTLVLSIVDYLALTTPGLQALFLHKTYQDASLLGYRNRKFLNSAGVPLPGDSLSRQELQNGSVLYFRSSDPESCGRGLDSIDCVVFEECGFYDSLDATIGAIAPAQTWVDNAISLFVSTPNGMRGNGARYWQLVSGGDDAAIERRLSAIRAGHDRPFHILRGDTATPLIIAHWRAVDRYQDEPDFRRRIIEESGISEETFAQEYDLDFSTSESETVFNFALVDSATGGEWAKPEPGAVYYLGVDSATSGADFSVCVVIHKVDDAYQVVHLYRKQKGTTEQHLSAIARLIRLYDPIGCTIEKNGGGQIWLEQLAGMEQHCYLEGHATTRTSKETLIGRLVLALERGDLMIPDSPITQELLTFQRSNNNKLEAAAGSHDDCVIALALSLAAAGYGQN